jgi:hypothetical protein
MSDLMSDIASAPSNEEEENLKRDVALVLWSHLTENARRNAWRDLLDIRNQAKAWVVQDAEH